jgi:hypothetical protein
LHRYADIYVSIEFIRNFALENGILYEEELARVIAHGILHLVGYDDDTPEAVGLMREAENDSVFLWKKTFEGVVFHVEHKEPRRILVGKRFKKVTKTTFVPSIEPAKKGAELNVPRGTIDLFSEHE